MTASLVENRSQPQEEEQYLSEIRKIPRLTPDEERALAQRCAQGDEEAVRQMVSANLRLVVSVAREYAGRGVPLLDLIQEGTIGLLAAAKKFDYSMNFHFSTYATKWIRQGITKYLTDHISAIRVPAYTAQRLRKLLAVQRELAVSLEREPTVQELAAAVGLPEDKLSQLLRLAPQTCSLDAPVGDEEGSLGEILQDTLAPEPQQTLVRQELKKTLDGLLSLLTQRQQQVLRLRFGMVDGICHPHESIGTVLGISKERSRQLEKQGIARLQKLGAGLGLEDFLE